MSRSDEINALAEDIAASYGARRMTVERIVKDTHEMLGRFHEEHKRMARDLRQTLASSEKERKEAFARMMERIRGELATLKKETHDMLAHYADDNRQAHESWVKLTKMMAQKRAEARKSGKS